MLFSCIFGLIFGAFVGLVFTQSVFKGRDWIRSSATGDLDWIVLQACGAVLGALCSAFGGAFSALNGHMGLSWAFLLLGGFTFPLGALIVGSVINLGLEPMALELAAGLWKLINRLSDSIGQYFRKPDPERVANLLHSYAHLVKTHGGDSPEAEAFLKENSNNREFIAASGVIKVACHHQQVSRTTNPG